MTVLGRSSRVGRVRVRGRPVLVERTADLAYARFEMRRGASAAVEIEVVGAIGEHEVFPEERVAGVRADGATLRFELLSPDSVVVRLDGREIETLVLLPDPAEEDVPAAGAPGVVDVIDHGADPTGRTLSTAALQAAIDAAAGRAGGGTVVLPRGIFLTGTLALRSNVTLYLAAGALLQGSADPGDYPLDPGRVESAADASLPADARFHGRTMTFSRLLLVDRAENVRIRGRGTIDGAGTLLRTRHGAVPNLLRIRASAGVTIEDVLFRNAAAWSLHVLASRDVAIRNVRILNDRANLNTDGIDVDSSTDVLVDRAFIHTKDDAICVKATRNGDLAGNPARITVTNSVVSSVDAGLKIGSETDAATISDVVFEHDFVFDSGRAMSVVVRDGATVERVTFRKITVGPAVDHLVEQVIGVRDPEVALGSIRDLAVEDVRAPNYVPPASAWTWYAQFRPGRPGPDAKVAVFEGADPDHAVDGLRLHDVVVNGHHLRDAPTASEVAGLTIGLHVRNVTVD